MNERLGMKTQANMAAIRKVKIYMKAIRLILTYMCTVETWTDMIQTRQRLNASEVIVVGTIQSEILHKRIANI